jgi:hypothetical protein
VVCLPILTPPAKLEPAAETQLQELTDEQQSALEQLRKRQPWLHVSSELKRHEHHDFEDSVIASAAVRETDPIKTDEEYWRQHFKQYCSDQTLLRYLRAHNYNVEHSMTGLVSTLQWRRRFRPHLIQPDSIEEEQRSGKTYLNGFDRQGHPLIYIRGHRETTKDYQTSIRQLVFNVETAIRLMPSGVERLTILFDFSQYSSANAAPVNVSKYFLHLFSHHYPERVAAIYGCNAPWYFWVFFKIMSPFIHPVTRAKIHFVDTKTMDSITADKEGGTWVNLKNHIEPAVLEKDFKGDFAYNYDHASYWPEFLKKVRSK